MTTAASFTTDGAYRWAERFGGAEYDVGGAIAVATSCRVVVVGNYQGTLDIGGNPLVGAGSDNTFVAEFVR